MPHLTEEESEASRRELSAIGPLGPTEGSGPAPCPWCSQISGADNHDQLFRVTSDPRELRCVDKSILLPCLDMLYNTDCLVLLLSVLLSRFHVHPMCSRPDPVVRSVLVL